MSQEYYVELFVDADDDHDPETAMTEFHEWLEDNMDADDDVDWDLDVTKVMFFSRNELPVALLTTMTNEFPILKFALWWYGNENEEIGLIVAQHGQTVSKTLNCAELHDQLLATVTAWIQT